MNATERQMLDQLIQALNKAGFFVTSGDGKIQIMEFKPLAEGEKPSSFIISDKGSQPGTRVPKEVEYLLYAVFPRKDWEEHVLQCEERGDHSWCQEASAKADLLDPIFKRFGYEMSSIGGNPPNISYSRRDGQTLFMYTSNPYHS
jgi:hypothetical protein